MNEHIKATLESPRIVRKPSFIGLNDLERLCGENFQKAVCVWSTTVKQGIRLGRCDHDEYHLIKDWLALLPNDEAREFAKWLLTLAAAAWQEQFDGEYSLTEYAP